MGFSASGLTISIRNGVRVAASLSVLSIFLQKERSGGISLRCNFNLLSNFDDFLPFWKFHGGSFVARKIERRRKNMVSLCTYVYRGKVKPFVKYGSYMYRVFETEDRSSLPETTYWAPNCERSASCASTKRRRRVRKEGREAVQLRYIPISRLEIRRAALNNPKGYAPEASGIGGFTTHRCPRRRRWRWFDIHIHDDDAVWYRRPSLPTSDKPPTISMLIRESTATRVSYLCVTAGGRALAS